MSPRKAQPPRKTKAKLEPIDWRELANDAVLNGNMSTLYRRPASEDPSTYASDEALGEIRKRTGPAPEPPPPAPEVAAPAAGVWPPPAPAVPRRFPKIKIVHEVADALSLAGQILYRGMYGNAGGFPSVQCSKGYRQLSAETHLDKDTVRDLIADFKRLGMVREIGRYDPDTRSPKTYEVLSGEKILQLWRSFGLYYVRTGRRPAFCDIDGVPLEVDVAGGAVRPQPASEGQ